MARADRRKPCEFTDQQFTKFIERPAEAGQKNFDMRVVQLDVGCTGDRYCEPQAFIKVRENHEECSIELKRGQSDLLPYKFVKRRKGVDPKVAAQGSGAGFG